jgi:Uma2 family endonuclease
MIGPGPSNSTWAPILHFSQEVHMPLSFSVLDVKTMGELLEQLGGISPHRIRLDPVPGTASEQDLIRLHERTDRLYELVDGTLVEKVMGYLEGSLAAWMLYWMQVFLQEHDLGNLAGPDGTLKLVRGLIRTPNISFVSWERLPGRKIPRTPIPGLVPDLAVEILSEGNTPGEMTRKLKEYFLCGVRLVWFVDPDARTVRVHTAPDQCRVLDEDQTLDGGDVLPGFSLPVKRIFERTPREAKGSSRRRTADRTKKGRKRK